VTAPEANVGKTKCLFMSCEENAGQSQIINIDKKFFESVLGTTPKKQNCIHD
jgi:hypothetical protein